MPSQTSYPVLGVVRGVDVVREVRGRLEAYESQRLEEPVHRGQGRVPAVSQPRDESVGAVAAEQPLQPAVAVAKADGAVKGMAADADFALEQMLLSLDRARQLR